MLQVSHYTGGPLNAFFEHHKDSIQFGYRCFDRILLIGLIQPFQQPERVLGFFNTYREGKRVTKQTLTEARTTRAGATNSWSHTSGTPNPTQWWRCSKHVEGPSLAVFSTLRGYPGDWR